jgi:hypothetical protein
VLTSKSSPSAFRRLCVALASGALMLLAPAVARAQDPTFKSAKLETSRPPTQPYIALGFRARFDPVAEPQILQTGSYRVTRIKKGEATKDRFLGIDRVTLDPDEIDTTDPNQKLFSTVRVYLATPLDLTDDDTVTVFYVANAFNGRELKAPVISMVTKIEPRALPSTQPTDRSGDSGGFNFKKAKGREDAHLYFAGELNRASGTPFSGSVDLKVELPLSALRTARHELLPFLDLKASNDPEADPDTIKAGVESKLIVAQAGLEYSADSPVVGIAWNNSARIEGDRDFDNTNAIVSSVFLFPLKPVFLTPPTRDRAFVEFTPFVGFEGGKNLASPVAEAEGRGVARLLVGSNIFARVYQGNEDFARVTLDGVYERRWPMLSEVGFRDDTIEVENGKDKKVQVPAFFGKGPRQWAEAKLNYNFNQFFSMFAGYQYGEQPPSYKLVDHSFRFGLVFKAKIK